jgi:hypothetical protein
MAARSGGRSLLTVPVSFAQPARAYSVQGSSNESDCHAGLKQKKVLSRGVSRALISEFQGIGFTCGLPTSASLTSDLFNSPALPDSRLKPPEPLIYRAAFVGFEVTETRQWPPVPSRISARNRIDHFLTERLSEKSSRLNLRLCMSVPLGKLSL